MRSLFLRHRGRAYVVTTGRILFCFAVGVVFGALAAAGF